MTRLCLFGALLAAAGCGELDGSSQPFAGMVVHCASDYHVPALVPPWVLVPVTDSPSSLMFVLPLNLSSATALGATNLASATAALQSLTAQARDFLQVELLNGTPAEKLATLAAQGAPVSAAQAIKPVSGTPMGASGRQLCWRESSSALALPQRLDAYVDFPGSGVLAGKTVHLTFRARDASGTISNPLCGDPMIAAMILGTAPGGTRQQVCK